MEHEVFVTKSLQRFVGNLKPTCVRYATGRTYLFTLLAKLFASDT